MSKIPDKLIIINEALAGKVICNIGQVDAATKRALDKLARDGVLRKWRGYWHPVPGGNWGIGPLKTCWGLKEVSVRDDL